MKESTFREHEKYIDMYRQGSTKEVKRIFRRFLEEIPKFGQIELKPFVKYPSFYAGHRLVGVECQKDRVKLHVTSDDAQYAHTFDELRNSIYPQKGREEWTFIYIVNELQVKPALAVIKKAYQNRKSSEINLGLPKEPILPKQTFEEMQIDEGDNVGLKMRARRLKT